jgi:hypothetical protein
VTGDPDAAIGTGLSCSVRTDLGSPGRAPEAAAQVPVTAVRDAEAADSHSVAVLRAPAPPCHCGSTTTTVCPDSYLTVQWTSESGATKLSVHLPSAADTADVSVSELHAYPDRIHSTSSAETSPTFRHCIP